MHKYAIAKTVDIIGLQIYFGSKKLNTLATKMWLRD